MASDPSGDIKGILALLAIVIFIVLGVYSGFGWTSFILLIGFLIVLSASGKKKEIQTGMGALVLIGGVIYFIFGALGVVTVNATAYFIFLAFCIAPHLELRNAVALVGFVLLSVLVFGAGILGYIVFAAVFAFVYATLEDAAYGAFMLVPLLIVGWFVGSGWAATVEQEVTSISTKVSAETGISTDVVENKVTSALNNTWLLFTDPNKWYEKQFVEKGTRDTGMTSSALEITKIEALPNTVMPKDTFDIVFEMENKGIKPAENVQIGAVGGTLADACGKVEGKFCNPGCVDPKKPEDLSAIARCGVGRPLGSIAQLEKRFDSFTFQAPECPGTYSVQAMVKYNYLAEATTNLQMISREYYDDLLRNNKMKWIDELSVASAGPFKVTLRTDRQQPIPVTESGDAKTSKPQVFKIYLGLINEHTGKATLDSATIKIPSILSLSDVLDAENKMDDSCSITYDFTIFDDTTKKDMYLSDYRGASIKEYTEKAKAFRKEAESRAAKSDGYIAYLPISLAENGKKPELEQNDWRYYKCNFKAAESEKDKISQIQTLFIRANIGYLFEYSKAATITVRGQASIPQNCQKDKDTKAVSAISTAQTTPQAREAILAALAKEIFYCYNKNYGWIWDNDGASCGEWKIDLSGCEGDSEKKEDAKDISLEDVKKVIRDDKTYNEMFKGVIDVIDVKAKNLDNADVKSTDLLFDNKNVYKILLDYHDLFGSGGKYIDIHMTSRESDVGCKAENTPCEGAGEGNCAPALKCWKPDAAKTDCVCTKDTSKGVACAT